MKSRLTTRLKKQNRKGISSNGETTKNATNNKTKPIEVQNTINKGNKDKANNKKSIIYTVALLLILNIPLIILLFKTSNISNEQLKNNIIVTEHISKFNEFKANLTTTSPNLSGITIMYKNHYPNKHAIANIKTVDQTGDIIYEKGVKVKANNMHRNNLFIPIATDLTPTQTYKLILSFSDYNQSFRINSIKDEVIIRPTYQNKPIDTKLLYNRISQYKPKLLKAPTFILIYLIFNIAISVLIYATLTEIHFKDKS